MYLQLKRHGLKATFMTMNLNEFEPVHTSLSQKCKNIFRNCYVIG